MSAPRQSRTIVVLAGVAAVFVALPVVGVAVRMPWSSARSLVTSPVVVRAAVVSLETSVIAALLTAAAGIPLAWVLARSGSWVARVVRPVVVVPMILPPVVAGIALLSVFGRNGIIGGPLHEWWGVTVPFTPVAVVLSQAFVSMPFLVLAVESSFRQLDTGLEDAARTLGASPARIFATVALPAARPAVLAGVVLAWARSVGEFGASITFAGSFPGRTQTLPMSVYELVAVDYDAALAVSFAMVLVSVAVVAGLRGRWMVAR